MSVRGYVVRYTNEHGTFYVTAPEWLDDYSIGTSRSDEGALFDTIAKAAKASRHPRKNADVRIFEVLDDGTETPLPSYEEALERLALVDDILAATGHQGDADTLVARVGRALDDEDIPGEEQAKIAAAANREWCRTSNTTQGSEADRLEAANGAQRKAYADGKAAFRAARRARKAGVL